MAYDTGYLYAGDSSGSLVAIDVATGKLVAKAELGAKIGGVSALPDIGISAGDYEGYIRLFSAPALKPLWTSRAESFVNGAASLAGGTLASGLLAVASCDARLYLYRAKEGTLAARVEMGSYLPQPPPAMDGRVFALSYEGRAALVDAASGKTIWTRDLGGAARGFLLAPALSPSGAFFASKDGWLRGLSLARGATIFETRSGSEAAASPVVAGSLVLLPDTAGTLRAHSTKDGSLAWSLDLGSIPSSQASVASAGMAIGMGDGRVLFYSWPK
jgi:outer membrane protein assembly factor BamB